MVDLPPFRSRFIRSGRFLGLAIGWIGLGVLPFSVAPGSEETPSERSESRWWEAETAMSEDGRLPVRAKAWWKRAQALKAGESFLVESEAADGGRMLVRREELFLHGGRPFGREAIVWVIDDDGDLPPDAEDGDRDSDCYVVDFDGDGVVDRMVDYMDRDADGRAEEMDVRYYADGQLRLAWFGIDYDGDGHMWDVPVYQYAGDHYFRDDDPKHVDPYDASGDAVIIANKYDPERKQWTPISECPFAWYDTDGDGESEITIRAAAVPLQPYPPKEPDYGNSGFNTSRFEPRLRNIGVVNVRYCVDLADLSSPSHRFHYDLGFNMTGDQVPYEFDGMHQENPLRRPPRAIVCIPHKALRELAEAYPANETGLSWHEYEDDTVTIGPEPRRDEDRRIDGVFWTWSRRFMHDTGGPIQNWNIRREFRPTPSTRRELYYSGVDRRIHLKGATEGWVRVGHLGGSGRPWGEIRYFDTDGDGYFDRWETHRAGVPRPVRVSSVGDARVRELPHDWDELRKLYVGRLLPEALRADRELIAAMSAAQTRRKPEEYLTRALNEAEFDAQKLYVLGIIRESMYLALHEKLATRSKQWLADSASDRSHVNPDHAASVRAWDYARTLSLLDTAYGEGRYRDVAGLLGELEKLDPKAPDG